jgi:hypothetical protein
VGARLSALFSASLCAACVADTSDLSTTPIPGRDASVPDRWPPIDPDGGTLPPDDTGVPDGGVSPDCGTPGPIACSCPDGQQGTQWCRVDGTVGACQCAGPDETDRLRRIQLGMLGRWQGTRTTVWDGTYPVEVEFFENARYTAHCLTGCVALYYGTDDDSPEKIYEVFDVRANDTGQGTIVVFFATNNTNVDRLDLIDVSEDENLLSFEVWHGDVRNPITFDLERMP